MTKIDELKKIIDIQVKIINQHVETINEKQHVLNGALEIITKLVKENDELKERLAKTLLN